MTKYEELLKIYQTLRTQYTEYRESCMAVAGHLGQSLREHLEAPETSVAFYAVSGPLEGRRLMGPSSVLQLLEDSFWHYGMVIDLPDFENFIPNEYATFEIKLKKFDDHFLVCVEGREFKYPNEDPATFDYSEISEHIFQTVKGRYDNSLKEFLYQDSPDRRHGF